MDGSPHPTKILTDHKGLQWLNSAAELNERQARWVEKLADIEYEVHYVPGPRNAAADALSRRADFEVEADRRAPEDGVQQPQAPRLKITLAEVQGSVTEERPLWESRVEALTFREELKQAAAADPWYSVKLKGTAASTSLMTEKYSPNCCTKSMMHPQEVTWERERRCTSCRARAIGKV